MWFYKGARPYESTQSEIVGEEKIATDSEVEIATMPKLKPELDVASESDTRILGAGATHTLSYGWYGTEQRGGKYSYEITKITITNTQPT